MFGNCLTEMRFYHATFSEYLQDRSRSGRFSVNRDETYHECALHLARHANIAKSSMLNSYSKDWQRQLYPPLAGFLEYSPASKVGMKEIWALLANDIGEYSQVPVGSLYSNLPLSKGSFYNGLAREDQLRMLRYLQKCNIPEIEPDTSHRQAISKHLSSLFFDSPAPGAARVMHRSLKYYRGE